MPRIVRNEVERVKAAQDAHRQRVRSSLATIGSASRTLVNPELWVRERPWTSVAVSSVCAFAAGFACAKGLRRVGGARRRAAPGDSVASSAVERSIPKHVPEHSIPERGVPKHAPKDTAVNHRRDHRRNGAPIASAVEAVEHATHTVRTAAIVSLVARKLMQFLESMPKSSRADGGTHTDEPRDNGVGSGGVRGDDTHGSDIRSGSSVLGKDPTLSRMRGRFNELNPDESQEPEGDNPSRTEQ